MNDVLKGWGRVGLSTGLTQRGNGKESSLRSSSVSWLGLVASMRLSPALICG